MSRENAIDVVTVKFAILRHIDLDTELNLYGTVVRLLIYFARLHKTSVDKSFSNMPPATVARLIYLFWQRNGVSLLILFYKHHEVTAEL